MSFKILFLFVIFNFSICAASNAQDNSKNVTITVSGSGNTAEEAKQAALRSAIEQAYGSFISTKTEVFNDRVVADEMASVSSGNIQSYKMLNESQLPNGTWGVTLNALVSIDKLTSFAESKGMAVEIKGGIFALNIKQQLINEASEQKIVSELVEILHEALQVSFDYVLKAGEPKSKDGGSQNWEIPVTVSAIGNSNLDFSVDYLTKTLNAISLSENEVERYHTIEKPVYLVRIWQWQNHNYYKKSHYFYLRNRNTLSILLTLAGQWNFYKNFPLLANGKIDIKEISKDNTFNYLDKQDISSIITNAFKKVLNLQSIDINSSFFDLGGDSFTLLNLLVECEKSGLKILPEHIYNFKTIDNLAKHLGDKLPTDNSVKKLKEELESLKKIFPINQVDKKNERLINTLPQNIFLTGATGFLGSRVLNDLLKHTQANIYCLVRDIEKLKSIENYDLYKDRIKPIIGDITKPNFALSEETFKYLQIHIDSIYHIAADTNHFKTYEELKAANVDSLITILNLMSSGKYKKLNYASTLSVFVDTQPLPDICLETDQLENTEIIYGGYAQTKWLSEKLLQSAKSYGDIYIYRLGLLTQDESKGYDGNFDWFNSFIKGLAQLNVIPKLDRHNELLSFDFTSVNFASKFMILNCFSEIENNSIFETFHVTSKNKISFSMLIRSLKSNNIELEIIDKKSWLETISINSLSKFGKIAYLALKNIDSHLSIFKTTNTDFDNTQSLKLSNKFDLQLPKIDQEDLKQFVKTILENT